MLAIKVAVTAPEERKAMRRFLTLMDVLTPDAAGNAMWLCWLNKDIAVDALEAMLSESEGNKQ